MRLCWFLWVAPLAFASCGVASVDATACKSCPAIAMTGVPNLHRVSANVYRSAQPTAEGMKNLQRELGVKTVINLRYFHSDKDEIGDLPLKSVHLPTLTWSPDRENARQLMALLSDPSQGPVLIHCQHGADRTGSMCALYRVKKQHWTEEDALKEMTAGGFGYHPIWKELPDWTRQQMERPDQP